MRPGRGRSWTSATASGRAASRACSGSPSTPTTSRTGASSSTTRTPTATRSSPSSRARAPTAVADPTRSAILLDDRPAVRQPQRRDDRVRPRRLPVHRHGRRRQRRRPAWATASGWTRCSARCCASTSTRAIRTPSRPTTRSPTATAAARDLVLGPAQPVALLVRPRDRRHVRRRRRPEQPRGDRRRAGRRGRPQLRLEHHGRRPLLPTDSVRHDGPDAAGRRRTHATTASCSVTGGYVYRGAAVPRAARRVRLLRLLQRQALGVRRAKPRWPSGRADPILTGRLWLQPVVVRRGRGGRAVPRRPRRRHLPPGRHSRAESSEQDQASRRPAARPRASARTLAVLSLRQLSESRLRNSRRRASVAAPWRR